MTNDAINISNRRLQFAANRFLLEMRRQQISINPNALPTVKDLSAYSNKQKTAIMKAVRTAIISASPKADEAFERWLSEMDTVENSPK